MRRTCRIGLLGLAIALPSVHAQGQVTLAVSRDAPSSRSILDLPARLELSNTPLVSALTRLSETSGVAMAFSASLLSSYNKHVSCACRQLNVGEALGRILGDAPLRYRVLDGQIVITPALPPRVDRAAAGDRARSDSASLHARAGIVSGLITDSATHAPLAEVTVQVEGTTLATGTAVDGRYRIIGIPAGTIALRVRRIGYASAIRRITVTDGQTVTVDFALIASAVQLGGVVVTGTAGETERIQQPAVVGTIDAATVAREAPIADVTQLLQGRIPGLVVSPSSGTSGTAARINLRGAASVSLSNEPLVFIDGVRVEARPRDLIVAYSTEGVGGQTVSALNDLNPDDIERIEVVKGPAAATLYGADASAGVIQIITKRGTPGVPRFSQTLTTEWNNIDPNFDPGSTYAACGGFTGQVPSCPGSSAADSARIVSVDVFRRDHILRNGQLGSFQYGGRAGGDSYGLYLAGGLSKEDGTLPNTGVDRRSARANFSWLPNAKVRVEANFGVLQNIDRIPQSDDAIYGYTAGAYLGDPRTAGVPALGDGWLLSNWGVAAGSSIDNRITSVRTDPSVQVAYTPRPWFNTRIIAGADYDFVSARAFFPLNSLGWYAATPETANGEIEETRDHFTTYTVDYLGTIHNAFGSGRYTSDFSFGTQYIDQVDDRIRVTGQGLTTNATDIVSAAANIAAAQFWSENKSFGYLAQEQLGIADRLFLQVGARVDKNSAFGSKAPSFFLPKAGISYVVSQEGFWHGLAWAIPTLRLRAAYGTTGRAPTPGASLTTYAAAPFILNGALQPGVLPLNPGNPNLKAERGKEFEAGVDADFINHRAGLELTYFNKATSDLLLRRQLSPSLGFTQNPYVNLGKVDNRGIEFALHGTLIERAAFAWDATLSGSTLRNRLISLGGLAPFTGGGGRQRYVPGSPLGAYYTYRVVGVDPAGKFAIVSDTPQYVGSPLPTFNGNLLSNATLFRIFHLQALLESKSGFRIFDITHNFGDRFFSNTPGVVLPAGQGGFSTEERLRRLGPYQTQSGKAVLGTFGVVDDPYIHKGDFVRFRELSATVSLPNGLARQLRSTQSSLTVGVRNAALWTSYPGDPEVLSSGPGAADSPQLKQFVNQDEFALPQPRRWIARLNLQF
jgi:TonB-linked SusC/RagA family outer membrane protein